MLIDIGVLVLCGQLLEPLWGALEFLVNKYNYYQYLFVDSNFLTIYHDEVHALV